MQPHSIFWAMDPRLDKSAIRDAMCWEAVACRRWPGSRSESKGSFRRARCFEVRNLKVLAFAIAQTTLVVQSGRTVSHTKCMPTDDRNFEEMKQVIAELDIEF